MSSAIKVKTKGDFKKIEHFLGKAKRLDSSLKTILEKYGRVGVDALAAATPVDTGLTASSWFYEIELTDGGYAIHWSNSNIQNGINIALLIQLGHGTRSGTYVQPNDYINPALKDIFDQIAIDVWREVSD